jgi:hypothetical protein
MIKFVDLTSFFGSESRCCAFLNTNTDTFVKNEVDTHVFDSFEEVDHAMGEVGTSKIPEGFFDNIGSKQ